MEFEIIIDDRFMKMNSDESLIRIDRKHVLSLANDFEDGNWRFKKFQNFIWDNIAETALTFRERQSLSTKAQSMLSEAAQKLRLVSDADEIGRGSEIAEIVLYGIMKHHFKALPVVPKIYFKQNVNDNAKGADSVHIVVTGDQDFTVWFGEAKFYNSIENVRLGKIVKSVNAMLETKKLKKENSIILGVSDLDLVIESAALSEQIRSLLSSQESIDSLKPYLHIPILLLHECEITTNSNMMTSEYKDSLRKHHEERAMSYFKKQIALLGDEINMYDEISFHLIFFPVPNKALIVEKFIKLAEGYKAE